MSLRAMLDNLIYTKYRVTESQIDYLYQTVKSLYEFLKPIVTSRKVRLYDTPKSDYTISHKYILERKMHPENYYQFRSGTVTISIFLRGNVFQIGVENYMPSKIFHDSLDCVSNGFTFYGRFFANEIEKAVAFYHSFVADFIFQNHDLKELDEDYL